MSKTSIRPARPEDAGVLIEFNRSMARETEAKELPEATISAGVRTLLENPSLGFYVVAEIDGKIAGSLMITTEWSDWRNGDFWWIQSVYVRPDYRRTGIYRALYDFVKRNAAEAGQVCGFRLYVERDNHIAQKTYESIGMHETNYRVFEETFPVTT